MKSLGKFLAAPLIRGAVVLAPVYLALLLVLHAANTAVGLVKPISHLLPEWLPRDTILSVLLVLLVCFVVGVAVQLPFGRHARRRVEASVFERIPGYTLFRGLSHQLAGEGDETAWKPALVEIEQALVPAFIIEQLDDGRYTVFVPSVPTPMAGTVYVLTPERVHLLNVPLTTALKSISRWGSGSKELVAAIQPK